MRFLSEQQFENKESERAMSYSSNVAHWLHLYPPADVLAADYVYAEWRPDLVTRVLKYLVPDNVRVTVLSKKCRFFTDTVSTCTLVLCMHEEGGNG